MATEGEFYLGMMSGTSADGIDAALVRFDNDGRPDVFATRYSPYPLELQERINSLGQGNTATATQPSAVALDQELAKRYADAAIKLIAACGIDPDKVQAIANHGQTVAHRPNETPPVSLQLGDPQILANLSGRTVISRFRQADLEHGGQGAPLMPAFHLAMIENQTSGQPHNDDYFFLNLGGIANISRISCTKSNDQVVGFDTGPANTLLNQWIKQHQGVDYDADGRWAASGRVQHDLLQRLLGDPYFELSYPKSTGPDYFNLKWLQQAGGSGLQNYQPADVQATLLALTVESIAAALKQLEAVKGKIVICGGGVNNAYLLQQLGAALPDYDLMSSTELGVPPDWVEAVGFAWLGWCFQKGKIGNLPSVTGARKSVVLGEQYQPA